MTLPRPGSRLGAGRTSEFLVPSRVQTHQSRIARESGPPGERHGPATRWAVAGCAGHPITVGAVVERTGVDLQLGALRSRLGKRGQVLRRSATRLGVRFEGETTLARIQPALLRVVDS